MKLTAKLLGVFLLADLLVTSLYGYLAVLREEQVFAQRAHDQAEQFTAVLEVVWRVYGTERFLHTVQMVPRNSEFQVRWVRFDAPPGDPARPVVPEVAYGAARLREIISIPARTEKGQAYVYSYWPLSAQSLYVGILEFSFPIATLEQARREAVVETMTLMAALTLSALLMVVLAGVTMVGAPLRKLTEKTRRIAEGELDQPLELSTGDELGQLAVSLNAMCTRLAQSQQQIETETRQRIAAVEQLRHADRLRTVGRLASGIAHELGTPLNVISGRADLIASGQLALEPARESAAIIKREAERMTTIIQQVLDFARHREPARTATRLEPIVRQTLALLSGLASKHGVSLRCAAAAETCAAKVDPGQIQQVLTNLVMNAVQASPAGAEVEVRLAQPALDAPGRATAARYVCLAVSDHGPGIAPAHREQIFEPFFTTKPVGEGTGLGLSIAHRIVEEHGGWIEVESEPGQGSTFRVYLPCVDEPPRDAHGM
jgi:signal transduction histidine kinase